MAFRNLNCLYNKSLLKIYFILKTGFVPGILGKILVPASIVSSWVRIVSVMVLKWTQLFSSCSLTIKD